MSIIIRLQNLPWSANALDIRRFFGGLSIPDGGVHIVGGEKGDAFIAFTGDEDARKAMLLNGGRIGTNNLKLLLSSKNEMQNVIAVARGSMQSTQGAVQAPQGVPQPQVMMSSSQQAPFNAQMQPNTGMGGPGQFMQPPSSQFAPQQSMMGQHMVVEQQSGQFIQNGQMDPIRMDHGRRSWDNRDRGDFDRREMAPPMFERARQDRDPFNAHQGAPIHDAMASNFRDGPQRRDNFRGPSPGRRSRFSPPPRDRFDERDRRKRTYERQVYVRLNNMPLPLNYKDVRKLFTGLEIPREGLKLINDDMGNRIGDAYIMFSTEDHASRAVRMNNYTVHGRSVKIEYCSAEAFDRAVDSFVPMPPRGAGGDRPPMKRARSRSPMKLDGSLAVVVKNLPFQVTKREIFRKFNGVRFAKGEASLIVEFNSDGRPAGTALLELASPRDLSSALRMHRNDELGGRRLDVINIPMQEYQERKERSQKYAPDEASMKPPPRKNSPLPMRDDVTRVKDERRGRSGPDEGSNGVKVKSESREQIDGVKSEDERRQFCARLHGVPFDVTEERVREFFKGIQIVHKGVHLVYQRDGKASHVCFVEFMTSEDCKKALARNKEYIGTRYINIYPISKQDMLESYRRLTEGKYAQDAAPPPNSQSVAGKVGRPGCVVGLQNLHYEATLEDILHFFKGFKPIGDSVKMRYSSQNGRPLGDAMLAFETREDAQRAVEQLHRRSLMGRPVSLAML